MNRPTYEFVKAAFRRPMLVSTVFPTSRSLAQTLLDFADVDHASKIVELGAGTGAITRYLAPRLRHPKEFLSIELDEKMVEYLRRHFPYLRFESGFAEDVLNKVVPHESVDSIVSSLPWTIFSDELQERTIDAILQALKPGGSFTTYVCVNAFLYPQSRSFMRLLRTKFSHVDRSELEWRNVPPAFVFRSWKESKKSE